MPDIKVLQKNLEKNNIKPDTVKKIMGNYYNFEGKPTKKENVAFYEGAMARADSLLGYDELEKIMYDCACCKAGKRGETIKRFAAENEGKSLKEKILNLSRVQYMAAPVLNPDGSITGKMQENNGSCICFCPTLGRLPPSSPISKSYCLCCAGHFKHHYQNALGMKLKVREIVSSPLNSGGKKRCEFVFDIVE